jgi:glucokinase
VAGVAEGCVIGVDLGGTKLLAGAVDPDGTVHHRTNRPALGHDQVELIELIAHAVEGVRRAVGGHVEAVGFGIPCTFDARTGLAVQAVNLPLHDIRFADIMAERLELPVVVDNDANCAVLAEARAGAGAGCSEVVMLTLGTGIGSGLFLRGEVYRGFVGGGAEIGHMVVDMDGRPCQGNCPNRGCLESVASGTALVREVSLAVARRPDTDIGRAMEGGRELTGPMVTEMAQAGDPVARAAIETIGRALGVGLANIANIFCPQVIVIGGGVSAAGELLLEPAREVMGRRALAPGRDEARVKAAAFGAEAGLVGAAILARERPSDVPSAAGPTAAGAA